MSGFVKGKIAYEKTNFITRRIWTIALPAFALFDTLHYTVTALERLVLLRKIDRQALKGAKRSFRLVFTSAAALPIALLVPNRIYRTGKQWTAIAVARMPSAITFNFTTGGRLGDSLIMYMNARYAAYRNNMPFLWNTRELVDKLFRQLKFSTLHKCRSEVEQDAFCRVKNVKIHELPLFYDGKRSKELSSGSVLYCMDQWGLKSRNRSTGLCPWAEWEKDKKFIELVRSEIAAIKPTKEVAGVADKEFNIAIHFRQGGGFDQEKEYYHHPKKLPPLDLSKEQLRTALLRLKDKETKPFRVHLFTDSARPKPVVEELKQVAKELGMEDRVRFTFRDYEGNPAQSDKVGVLDDFFAMARFDAILRSDSNFSQTAGLLGQSKLEIYPTRFYISKSERKVHIDQMEIFDRTAGTRTKRSIDVVRDITFTGEKLKALFKRQARHCRD